MMSLFTTNYLMKEVLSIIRSGLLFQNAVTLSGRSLWKSAGVLTLQPGHPSQRLKIDFATCQLHFRKRGIFDESHIFLLINANMKERWNELFELVSIVCLETIVYICKMKMSKSLLYAILFSPWLYSLLLPAFGISLEGVDYMANIFGMNSISLCNQSYEQDKSECNY